jgi:hypothetical protein
LLTAIYVKKLIVLLLYAMGELRAVPADFEDKLTTFLRNEFIDDTNADECDETVLFLVQRISSMFVTLKHKEDKVQAQVSAYTMFLRSKDSGDWKTMTEDEKMEYRILADEENARRGSKVINHKRVSARTLFKQEFKEGDWNDLSEEQKQEYKDKSKEHNALCPGVERKQTGLESKSYGLALRYLRKHMPSMQFATWSKLPNNGRQAWNEFVAEKLVEDMNKDLYKDLVYDAAQRLFELFIV